MPGCPTRCVSRGLATGLQAAFRPMTSGMVCPESRYLMSQRGVESEVFTIRGAMAALPATTRGRVTARVATALASLLSL